MRAGIVLAGLALALVVAWRLGLFQLEDRERLTAALDQIRTLPWLKPGFVCFYAVASAIGVPASPLTLAGGALFGVGWGIPLNWLGSFSGALLGYGIALQLRGLASRMMTATLTSRMTEPADSRGFMTLIRLRVIPVAPFALLNLGSALFGMRFGTFALATAIGLLPVTIIYTVFAASLVAGVAGSGHRALFTALVTAGALIALSFAPTILRRRRGRSLAE